MKKRNKGFVLLETMVVSAFVISTLVFLFVQFSNLKKSYDDSFKYNTIPGLYGVQNINKYLIDTNLYYKLGAEIDTNDDSYVELYNNKTCNSTYFLSDISYCNQIASDLNIKTLVIAKENLDGLKNKITSDNNYSAELLKFLKKISVKGSSNYRIIAEYNDNTFANIEVSY